MPRTFLRHFIFILGLLVACLLGLGTLILSTSPNVTGNGSLNEAERREVEQLIADYSPNRLRGSGEQQLTLNAHELTMLGNVLLNSVPGLQPAAMKVAISGATADGEISIPQTLGPFGTVYLNLSASFAQQGDSVQLTSLRAGRLPIPRYFTNAAQAWLASRLQAAGTPREELLVLRRNLDNTALANDELQLRLQWNEQTLERLRSQARQWAISAEDRERVRAYYQEIVRISEQQAVDNRFVSLHRFLPSLFTLAVERSDSADDAIAENRALLLTLSMFTNELPVSDLLGSQPDIQPGEADTRVTDLRTMMFYRHDLSLHFTTAAAIAASAGVDLADILGTAKEVYDSRQRSGFSFSDLTANLSGMALGEAATQPESAQQLQRRMAAAQAETDYMPTPRTDADGMTEEEFAQRFVDRSSDVYNSRLSDINELIAALPVYTD